MRILPVRSNMMVGIGYDTVTRELVAQFDADTYYLYFDVEPEVVTAVLFAESVGGAFTALVKRKQYQYERVDKERALA